MSRAKWKGPFVNLKDLYNLKQNGNLNTSIEINRNSEISPIFVGSSVKIHNGKSYTEINVSEDMVGHKFGEFSYTRSKYIFKKKKKLKK
jgi:small subunit ribosomal protein S19